MMKGCKLNFKILSKKFSSPDSAEVQGLSCERKKTKMD
jgi:hypothetical protein